MVVGFRYGRLLFVLDAQSETAVIETLGALGDRVSIARVLLLNGRHLVGGVVVEIEQKVLRVVRVGGEVGHGAARLGRGHVAAAGHVVVAVSQVLVGVVELVLVLAVGHGRLVDVLEVEGEVLRGSVVGRVGAGLGAGRVIVRLVVLLDRVGRVVDVMVDEAAVVGGVGAVGAGADLV